jgi:transcription elongation factor SPT6
LGKRLTIGGISFTEIDQIIAEYIEPMTRKITALIEHPKYQRKSLYEMYSYLQEQLMILKRSAYGFIISPDKPGSFLLVYRHPNSNNPRKELITVTPNKYEFCGKKFDDIEKLLQMFKEDEQKKMTKVPSRGRVAQRDYAHADPRSDPRREKSGYPYGGRGY